MWAMWFSKSPRTVGSVQKSASPRQFEKMVGGRGGVLGSGVALELGDQLDAVGACSGDRVVHDAKCLCVEVAQGRFQAGLAHPTVSPSVCARTTVAPSSFAVARPSHSMFGPENRNGRPSSVR